jgi:hypothetical protein
MDTGGCSDFDLVPSLRKTVTAFNINGSVHRSMTQEKCVCKPEAANTVRAPDDERCAARNMLSIQ